MPAFGVAGYQQLLQDLVDARYELCPTSWIDDEQPGDRRCYLRHDVDVHLNGVEQFAELEASVGARSTWFVPVTFNFNVLSEPNRLVLRRLVALGHEIGLHYDPETTLGAAELFEQVNVLEVAAGVTVDQVTSHKPGSTVRFVNQSVYSVPRHAEYVSDSARRWRDDRLVQLVKDQRSFMLLTHVEHWMDSEPDLMEFFWQTMLPNCQRDSQAHAITTINDCLNHK